MLVATVAASCGGSAGGGGGGGGAASIPIAMYQGEHASAVVDTNGGLYTHVVPRQLEAYGGSPQSGYTWTVTTGTSLPFPGLVIDPLTGLIHGSVPSGTAAGSNPFSVTASDGSSVYTSGQGGTIQASVVVSTCNSRTFSGTADPSLCNLPVRLNAGGGSVSNINALVSGTITAGKAFGFSMFVVGGVPPYKSWAVATGTLPPGLTLDQARGVLYGTPFSSAAGNTYTFSVSVSDSGGNTFPSPTDQAATYKIAIQ